MGIQVRPALIETTCLFFSGIQESSYQRIHVCFDAFDLPPLSDLKLYP